MTGKVETIDRNKVPISFLFTDLSVGEGVISNVSIRIRIDDKGYVQFIEGTVSQCSMTDWPGKVTGRKARFELVAREV